MKDKNGKIVIIGGGLAGSEAAFHAAKMGLCVSVHEMKPVKFSPAHSMEGLAELVCSNSLKSEGMESASGLLKEEMDVLGSIVIEAAAATRVPAGGSLAVDREAFSRIVTERLLKIGVEVVRGEVSTIPGDRPLVIATGPLTSEGLSCEIQRLVGKKNLSFYDAVSPVVYGESIDMERAFFASRYGRGGNDYINCPLDKEEYERLVTELTCSRAPAPRGFDTVPLFEGCMPIESMAGRGPDTLMFGPLKPVGLIDPRSGRRPYAVVQLRREDREGVLYNMVGFQTRLTYGEQTRIFRMIPALENARFARLGKLHRNTYIDSPGVISPALELLSEPGVFFAGQISGVEGYCESAVSGIIAGINAVRFCTGCPPVTPPPTTMTGALLQYITATRDSPLQPMNANFGLLPPLEEAIKGKRKRRAFMAQRALEDMRRWSNESLETSPVI